MDLINDTIEITLGRYVIYFLFTYEFVLSAIYLTGDAGARVTSSEKWFAV